MKCSYVFRLNLRLFPCAQYVVSSVAERSPVSCMVLEFLIHIILLIKITATQGENRSKNAQF